MLALAALAFCAVIDQQFGPGGLILLAIVVVLYLLLRTRPFASCASCRGHGARTRILGGPVTCRRCRGTGFATRADRRNAAHMPPRDTGGRR